LVEKKGFDLSLRMLAELDSTSTLDIVGEGPLSLALCEQAESLGVHGRVRFHGSLSHVESLRLISGSSCMLVPSRTAEDGDSEGIPNVIKEAMALGTLCIGSDHSGIPEIIQDRHTGFLFREDDLESFLTTVRHAFSAPDKLSTIVSAARELVCKEFDSDQSLLALGNFYSRAIARHNMHCAQQTAKDQGK